MKSAWMAILALAVPSVLFAQADVTVGGQLRPRYEFRSQGGTENAFVSMRTRLNVNAKLENNVNVFLQVQDVRLWGEETSTLFDFNADNLDLHQGYVEFVRPGETRLSARVGRQEVNFGGQRLVGAVNWTQQARAFDGADLVTDSDALRVDLFGAVLADATSAPNTDDVWFAALYSRLKKAGPGKLDLYGMFNSADVADTDQLTVGGRWFGSTAGFTYRAEASYQSGTRTGMDVKAFMAAGRLGKAFGPASVTLWYDHLSGDDNPNDNDIKVFDTLFATNHKFYGFADLFVNIPAHTGGRGLQDIAVKGKYKAGSRTSMSLALHSFRLAAADGVDAHLADEADLVVNYRNGPGSSFQLGVSRVLASSGMVDIGRSGDDMTWVYLMTNVMF